MSPVPAQESKTEEEYVGSVAAVLRCLRIYAPLLTRRRRCQRRDAFEWPRIFRSSATSSIPAKQRVREATINTVQSAYKFSRRETLGVDSEGLPFNASLPGKERDLFRKRECTQPAMFSVGDRRGKWLFLIVGCAQQELEWAGQTNVQ